MNRHLTRHEGMKSGGLAEQALSAVDPNVEDNPIFVVKTNINKTWKAFARYGDEARGKRNKRYSVTMQSPFIGTKEYSVFPKGLHPHGQDCSFLFG